MPLKSLALRLSAWWRDTRIAAIFLTQLPLRERGEIAPDELARATRAFPLVGAAVGLVGGAIYTLAVWLNLPPLAAGLAAVAATVLLTGALHEDGLADTADGFGGGRTRERKLEIMRDSRLGSYGAVALILSIGLRAAALAVLTPEGAIAALIAAHALGRAAIPPIMCFLPLARRDGLAADAQRPTWQVAGSAAALGLIAAAITLGPGLALACLLIIATAAVTIARIAQRQIGGYSGDVLGATEQLAETLVLLFVAAALT